MLRVLGAICFIFVNALWPLLLIVAIGLIGRLTGIGGSSLGVAVAILSMVAVIYAIIHTLFYWVLVPYVAMFEPQTPILKTPQRSKQLVKGGGTWFLVKGFFVYLIVSFIMNIFLSGSQGDKTLFAVAFLAALTFLIFTNATLVMYYRWRRAVRGQ